MIKTMCFMITAVLVCMSIAVDGAEVDYCFAKNDRKFVVNCMTDSGVNKICLKVKLFTSTQPDSIRVKVACENIKTLWTYTDVVVNGNAEIGGASDRVTISIVDTSLVIDYSANSNFIGGSTVGCTSVECPRTYLLGIDTVYGKWDISGASVKMSNCRTKDSSEWQFNDLKECGCPVPSSHMHYVSPFGSDCAMCTTLSYANKTAKAGDTIILMPGVYHVPIQPVNSGSDENRIVYKAAAGGNVEITGCDAAIELFGKSYITIDSIKIHDVGRGAYIDSNSSHVEIVNSSFWDNDSLDRGIYCKGGNALIHNNRFGPVSQKMKDGYVHSLIHLYGDSCRFENNTCSGMKDVLYLNSSNNLVCNNVIYNNSGTAIKLEGNSKKVTGNSFINNTIWNSLNGICFFDSSNIKKNRISNNIIGKCSFYGISVVGDSNSVTYNDVFCDKCNGIWLAGNGNDSSDNLCVDPQYVNVSEEDYHLKRGSPCVNMGLTIKAVTLDFEGNRRDSTPDIGAFEYMQQPMAKPANISVR